MNKAASLAVLRVIDKRDRLGLFGVFQLLTEGRRDDSGAFVKGLEMPRWEALAWCHFIAPPTVRKKIEAFMNDD